MSGRRARNDFTENLEAVAQGVRQLGQIRDPILREAVAAALRLRRRELRLDSVSRVRMRNSVLAALAPAKPTIGDRVYGLFAIIGAPAPMLVRALLVVLILAGLLGGATAASADALPDDPLYALKLAGEQLRLAIAVSPEDRASVELSVAEHRIDEAQRLAASGREDDAIIATASYGSSLADAAADLASVESTAGTAALVAQVQTALAASQLRVAAMATRLAVDPRTASAAEVLASVSATAAPSKDSPAAKIADQAAAITARLAVVADDRATRADAWPVEPERASVALRADPAATPTSATPRRSAVTPPVEAERATETPPMNPSAARQAAERAKEAAARALQAAEKAKRAGMDRTPDSARR